MVRFLLDHNVQNRVKVRLVDLGHDVELSKDVVGQEAEDPIVAAAAAETDRVLVSHDHDMKRVERFLSAKHRERFPLLSRVMLNCPEQIAAERLCLFMPLVEFEFEEATAHECPLLIQIQERRIRIIR